MKCVIPGINIKVFGRAVHSLAKIGDELYVEPGPTGVSLRTVNSSRSAFASFHFGSGFFSHYDEGVANAQKSDGADEIVKCKISMKAFLNVFKSLATLERNVEKCKLLLDGEADNLGVQFTCRYGIIKTYNLSFIECETLQAVYDKNSCTNYIQSQSKVLSDAVLNFQPSQEEVTLCVSQEKTIIRSYVDDEPDPAKAIHTVLTMEAGEFDGYDIATVCEVTFCLKELRAVLAFAEPINLPVTSYFDSPGSPIIFICDNKPMFEATFVLATLSKKTNSQIPRSQNAGRKVLHQSRNEAGAAASSPSASQNPRNQTLISESQQPGPSLQSRRSEQINNTPSRIHEGKGNVTLTNSSTSYHGKNHIQNRESESSSHQHLGITSRVNGNTSDLRIPSLHDETLPDLEANETNEYEMTDTLPGTPPPKKTKFFFRRCFESTFDQNSVPGNDRILAEDSDEDT